MSLFYRDSANYVVRFPELADFEIAVDRGTITCTPEVAIPDEVVANLYLNQIVPLVIGFEGGLVLHASAVSIGNCAIAFMGHSGRGKSTLAASFASAGYPFLTDDGLIVDQRAQQYMICPRAPVLRLRSDSASVLLERGMNVRSRDEFKEAISAGTRFPHSENSCPLAAIFALAEPQNTGDVEIAPLSRQAVVAELLSHSFILDVEDRTRVKNLFDRLIDLSASVECFSIDYPRLYSQLPRVRDTILTHLL